MKDVTALAVDDGGPISVETISQVRASEPPARQKPSERSRRLEQLVRDNIDFVWRLARHLGLPASDADDVAQRVMIVASNRLDDIEIGKERAFLYIPFEHSEGLADQKRSMLLFTALGDEDFLPFARKHHDIIERFGRFPHRNAILGRAPRPAEVAAGDVVPW